MKRRSSRQETAVKKKEMKIKVELLSNILNKVNAAVGGEDQLRIRFFPVSGKDAEGKDVTSNWVEFLAYSKGLQILQMMSYTGKAVANKETVLVVKASTLSGIVKSYMALGIEEATIEIKDNLLVVKNKQGQVTIPTAATMPVIDMAEAQKGAAWAVVVNTKEIQSSVRNVAATIGAGQEVTNGIYFSATDNGYVLLTTNTYSGSQSSVKGEFKPMTEKPVSKDFFVSGGLQKALAVLKGEALNICLTAKYLLIKDGEGTFAVIALNEGAFPKDSLLKMMAPASQPTPYPETFSVKVKKSVLEAALTLAEVTDTDKIKGIQLRGVQMGEKADLVTGSENNPQTVPAEVTISASDVSTAKLFLGTSLFRTVISNVGDDVKLRFTSSYVLVYDGNSEAPASWAFKRTAAEKKTEKTETDAKEE